MTCVHLSSPCSLAGMARQWPAFDNWEYKNEGHRYLLKSMDGKKKIDAYIDEDPYVNDFEGISFDSTYYRQMQYNDFYSKMQTNPSGTVML